MKQEGKILKIIFQARFIWQSHSGNYEVYQVLSIVFGHQSITAVIGLLTTICLDTTPPL